MDMQVKLVVRSKLLSLAERHGTKRHGIVDKSKSLTRNGPERLESSTCLLAEQPLSARC